MLDLSYKQILELGNSAFTKIGLPNAKGLYIIMDWCSVSITFFFGLSIDSVTIRTTIDLEEFKKQLEKEIKNR